MRIKRWSDLSSAQQICFALFVTFALGLLVAALVDLSRRSSDEVRGGRKLWFGLVFIDVFGPIAYFTIGRRPKVAPAEARMTELPLAV